MTGSFEIFLDATDGDNGSSVNVANYQVRVLLSGPNAGTDVILTGGGQASIHAPAAVLSGVLKDGTLVGTANYFQATFNLISILGAITIADGAGLIRVDYEVQPGAEGVYTLEIATAGTDPTLLLDTDTTTIPPRRRRLRCH